jgi:hypothetical protein
MSLWISPLPFGAGFLFFDNVVRRVDLRLLAAALKQGAKQPADPAAFLRPGVFLLAERKGEKCSQRRKQG